MSCTRFAPALWSVLLCAGRWDVYLMMYLRLLIVYSWHAEICKLEKSGDTRSLLSSPPLTHKNILKLWQSVMIPVRNIRYYSYDTIFIFPGKYWYNCKAEDCNNTIRLVTKFLCRMFQLRRNRKHANINTASTRTEMYNSLKATYIYIYKDKIRS
jgi:hypothetical protein